MIRSILRIALLAGFALSVGTLGTGCPKKGPTELTVEQQTDPVAVFQNGVEFLTTPNKEGIIDYSTAYDRFVSAAELFDSKGKADKGAKAHFNAAWTAEVLQDGAAAEKHYRLAFEGDPAYEKAMFSLTRVLSANGNHTEAIGLYRDFVGSHADRVDVRNELIVALATAGLYDEAMTEAQEILLKDPKNAAVYRSLSTLYYKKGNYGMSALCAEKSLDLNKGDSGTYNNLGVTYLLQENEAAAIEEFKTALKLDPKNYEANMNLGFVALNSGDYALALACLQRAVESNPQSIDAKLGLAVALRGNKDYTKAGSVYDEILKADPQNEYAYFNASTLHEKYTKDFTKALKYLDLYIEMKAGTIGPDHEVFDLKADVEKSKAAEEARIAEEKRLEAERKEREERALATLKELEGMVATYEAKVKSCDPAVQEEVGMMLEQAKEVITSKDTGMAVDLKSMFTDYYGPMVDACAGAAPAEAPAEGTPAEAPAAPAEGAAPAPAEGTPTETPAAPQ